jgi:hypothetical protein
MQSLCENRLQIKAGVAVRSAVTRRTVALARPAQRRTITQAVAFDIQELQNLPKEVLFGGAAALGKSSAAEALGCKVHSNLPSAVAHCLSWTFRDGVCVPRQALACSGTLALLLSTAVVVVEWSMWRMLRLCLFHDSLLSIHHRNSCKNVD